MKPVSEISIDSPYGCYRDENGNTIESIFKHLDELNLSECKQAFLCRLVENNKHPKSAFKPMIDEEMVLIAARIKKLKNNEEQTITLTKTN